MSAAGLDEDEDLFSPVPRAARRRAVWLGINLLTAFLASWVIGNFDVVIAKVVAVAVLMPIVASMGGIAGTQVLTLMVRALALGQVGYANSLPLLRKEILVAVLNGFLWAIVVGGTAFAVYRNTLLALAFGAAMIINLLAAALAGVAIPLVLRRMSIDPALAGGVILTTVTDCCGFASFLGLSTLLLLH
jgi:magnesium transporter